MFSCVSSQLNRTYAIVKNNCDVYFNPYTILFFVKRTESNKQKAHFGLRVKYPTVHNCSGWIKSKVITQ